MSELVSVSCLAVVEFCFAKANAIGGEEDVQQSSIMDLILLPCGEADSFSFELG